MSKNYLVILSLGFCLILLFTACCCDIHIGDWSRAKYERVVQQQAPLAPGSIVITETSFGSIAVIGAEVADCNVTAKIFVQAPTEQEAQEIAEQVQIKLEQTGNTLTIKAEKPHLQRNRSIGVSYNIIVPKQTSIECSSSYGSIELGDLDGYVKAKSSSGSVKGRNIKGKVELDSSYGSITCNDISGDSIRLKSSSGSLHADHIQGSVQLDTSYGSITCNDISNGDIKLKTSSGKITLSKASFGNCDAHTSYGSINSDELKGDLIKLHSSSGSIDVTNASAGKIDLSTSYGRIVCRQITTTDLTAKSGSGSIDIAFSQLSPAEIAADVETSYGNVDFSTPKGFAGEVSLSTSYGSVTTNFPITIVGEVGKAKLTGKIGEGKGKLHLRTSSGSIKLK
jgi:DUF4097 and DUF4098 domain-containing protein YvlB